MGVYRLSRNVEASIIDYITAQLTASGWTGVRTEKSFAEVYEGALPCICIMATDRPVKNLEIGSRTIFKDISIDIRIFATSDGQRLDLADWLLDTLLVPISYYTYTITNGVVSNKVLAGKINILKIIDNRKEFINIENLVKEDRYRHIISCDCRIAY